MPRLIQLVGQRFGKLIVTSHAGVNSHGQHTWACKCDCGKDHTVTGHHLRQGNTTSCGCLGAIKETHGKGNSRAYRIWSLMKHRCSNPNSPGWADYGGRGIAVCEQWQSFEGFYADMGDPPQGTTLDRRNNDLGYSKSNCHWATRQEQASNKRSNVFVFVEGERVTLKEASRRGGFNYKTATNRIYKGAAPQEVADALAKPA